MTNDEQANLCSQKCSLPRYSGPSRGSTYSLLLLILLLADRQTGLFFYSWRRRCLVGHLLGCDSRQDSSRICSGQATIGKANLTANHPHANHILVTTIFRPTILTSNHFHANNILVTTIFRPTVLVKPSSCQPHSCNNHF